MTHRGIIGRAIDRLRKPSRRGAPARIPDALGAPAFEYTPNLDGDPDPGEIVWTWVSYEDDPSHGKDRPVVVLGRHGDRLIAVALTSKLHEGQVPVGTGPWDGQGRPSYAKVDRLLSIDPRAMRREGAILDRRRFDEVVAGVHRTNSTVPRKSTGKRD
jgi:PemK-like, MazF-like toxin of type II toxin-antitoxin system